VQVPPPQFEKAEAKPDGSALAFFWDAVLRVQEGETRPRFWFARFGGSFDLLF
jgi:hypothetical protein